MASLFVHIKCKPEKAARFEQIARAMVEETRINEPHCARYEYWRAAEANTYYVIMSFNDINDFYSHQASPYHTGFASEFGECFDAIRLEWIDPLDAAHSHFPPTADVPLPADASEAMKVERKRFPFKEASWWGGLRERTGRS